MAYYKLHAMYLHTLNIHRIHTKGKKTNFLSQPNKSILLYDEHFQWHFKLNSRINIFLCEISFVSTRSEERKNGFIVFFLLFFFCFIFSSCQLPLKTVCRLKRTGKQSTIHYSFPVKWPNFIYTIPWWKSGTNGRKKNGIIEMGSSALRAWNGVVE